MASEDLPANGHGGPADPAAAKRDLRRHHRAVRAAYVAALTPDRRAALERALTDRLSARLPLGPTAAYHAISEEIDPGCLDRPLVFPRTVRGQPLTFHAAPRGECLTGALGIPEPPADASPVVPAVVLVPLLAADRAGHRLGQGGGFYDRTLAALRAAGPVFAVGVAWDVQLTDRLPVDPWDARLDALATPTRWLTFAEPLPMLAR